MRRKAIFTACSLVTAIGSLMPFFNASAATPATLTVDAAADYGVIPKNVLGKCYSESGIGMIDPADQNQIANLGRDCLIKRWGKENQDVGNRASCILRTLAGGKPGTYETFHSIIESHKKEHGDKFEFLEFANEPDYHKLSDDAVYAAFKAAYSAAYDYNHAAKPAVPVKIGGPGVLRGTYLASIGAFLDRYKADHDPKKSLGFISVHLYGDLMGFSNSKPRTLKADIVHLLTAHRLPTTTPIFITESSCFGAGRSQASEVADMLKQASFMATRDYYLVKHGFTDSDANFHWATRNSSARKNMLDFGPPGVATPYLNMLKMQVMLKSNRIYDGECNPDGWGLNCFATRDASGIAAMLINDQDGKSPDDFNVAFSINHLSSTALNGKKIRVEKYRIDATHNHCRNGGYDGKILEKLSDETIPFADKYATTDWIGKNAIELIVLSPDVTAPKADALSH